MFCVFTSAARCLALWVPDWWGAIAPKSPLRYVAIFIWIYSAFRGLQLAWEHTMIQLHPSPFMTCDFMARFPSWLPLDKWLPQVFVASGDCSVRQWEFLSLEMPQWLVGIFAAYLIVALLVLIAQPFKPKKTRPVRPLIAFIASCITFAAGMPSAYPISAQIPYPAASSSPHPPRFITTARTNSLIELFISNLIPQRIDTLSARDEIYPANLLLKSKNQKIVAEIAN
ncbi:Disulfide oxidoreductase [Kluyvera cryocrescens]|uniref:Disulfide oxidoreductase n=1 Tax=Kluyvera cryocrescens TaxID=580 RepID=A0A485BMC6_KLUCR|nr:Disulfide oxidoreductase [Kluyvera cryocrescens]